MYVAVFGPLLNFSFIFAFMLLHFELLCRHIGVKWSHNFTGHLKDEERDLI
ncbi:hypothetical protein HN51_047496, partial [Arachis hypogaea]